MINRVVLVGRLTKDPELRYTNTNIAVTTFTLAVSRNFVSQDGNKETDFIQCVTWKKTAENTSKYVHKGSLVGIDGRLQTRNYEKDGRTIYITEVICDNVAFLESKNQSQEQQTQSFTKADEQKFIKDSITDLPF